MIWLVHNSWLIVGSVSGSIVTMALARNLSFQGRMQTLIVGSLIGVFLGPAIVEIWLSSLDPATSRIPTAVCFLTGSCGVAVMPIIIKRAKSWVERIQLPTIAPEKKDD